MTTPTFGGRTELEIEREALRERLRREFHITALFVPAKTVACVLGVSTSTIYAYIRTDSFFLPYRLVNKTPMISLDDLVEWCLRSSSDWRMPIRKELAKPYLPGAEACESIDAEAPAGARMSAVDRAVAETLNQLGLPARGLRKRSR
jgi:hypothetical protein